MDYISILNDDSFFVHPRDKQASGRGSVLGKEMYSHQAGITKVDEATRILQDLFHGENDVSFSSCIFIPRSLPIECKACRVMPDSYQGLVAHCKQWSHRQNVDEARGRQVPAEFVDPRNTESYQYQLLSVFGKVMALKTFEFKFIASLHATSMNQDGIDNLMCHHQYVFNRLSEAPRLDDALDWREYMCCRQSPSREISTEDMHRINSRRFS